MQDKKSFNGISCVHPVKLTGAEIFPLTFILETECVLHDKILLPHNYIDLTGIHQKIKYIIVYSFCKNILKCHDGWLSYASKDFYVLYLVICYDVVCNG